MDYNFDTKMIKIATFKKDKSTPTIFMGIVRALLSGEPVKKTDILLKLEVDITKINVKGCYSEYFSKLNKAEVIKYNTKLLAWEQGKNYQAYLTRIFKELLSNDDFVRKFSDFLVKYESNIANFIMHTL